jgi:hypothetical protein
MERTLGVSLWVQMQSESVLKTDFKKIIVLNQSVMPILTCGVCFATPSIYRCLAQGAVLNHRSRFLMEE